GVAAWTPSRVDRRREEGHLQAASLVGPAGVDGHPREGSAPPDHLGVVTCPRRLPASDEMHRLKDVRFPGAVRTDECRNARGKFDLAVLVAAKVLEPDRGDAHDGALRSGRDAKRHHYVKVAVVADDLDDAGRERTTELQ